MDQTPNPRGESEALKSSEELQKGWKPIYKIWKFKCESLLPYPQIIRASIDSEIRAISVQNDEVVVFIYTDTNPVNLTPDKFLFHYVELYKTGEELPYYLKNFNTLDSLVLFDGKASIHPYTYSDRGAYYSELRDQNRSFEIIDRWNK